MSAATLIRNGRIEADDYQWPDDADPIPGRGRIVVGLDRWRAEADALNRNDLQVGVALPNTADIESLEHGVLERPLLVLCFPGFADGRAYSQARLLRRRGYHGELRASGDAVVLDQLQSMMRCGFDSFALRADQDPQRCLDAHRAFDLAYQPLDAATPLVSRLRRSTAP
ncbi:MAG: DUF934 domain-containing protein [Nevskiales bacterium]|nr:DUF934 domain-containing protein [Nevskiales bacterium]